MKTQMVPKETYFENKYFLSIFKNFLDIFTDFWSFTDNMLPSQLIKMYSIAVGYFLQHSCALLAKIPFDSMSFT